MTAVKPWEAIAVADLTDHLERSFHFLLRGAELSSSHPAQYYLQQLKSLGKETMPASDSLCSAVAQALLDRVTWAVYPPEDIWEVYGGEEVRRLLQPRLVDPGQYFDAMAELRLCGQMQQAAERRVRFDCCAGRPDLYLAGAVGKVWIEVKHLRPASRHPRLDKIVYKAGKQLKRATGGGGSGALHISVGRPAEWTAEDDDPHSYLVDHLSRAILVPARNRSVAQAVISWDDYVVLSGDRGTFLLTPRRRARVVRHPAPRMPAAIPDEYLSVAGVGPLVMSPSDPVGKVEMPTDVAPHRSLARKLARHGLKWQNVARSLRQPLAAEQFKVASTTVVLFVCAIKRGLRRASLLGGGVLKNRLLEVRWLYLLPPKVTDRRAEDEGVPSPLAVLLNLVQEYGVNMRVDDQLAPMIVAAHFPNATPDNGRCQLDSRGRNQVYIDQLGSRDGTHVVLQHAVDAERYHADLAAAGLAAPAR
jgi:hypothetical protein